MTKPINLQTTIPPELANSRLDAALAKLFPQFSRARLQQWLSKQQILVDGEMLKAKAKVKGGEQIIINATVDEQTKLTAQPIELTIVHEDDAILVINKPAGLVVHPGAGHHDGTLVNALLHHAPSLAALPRAGLIHRLDKNTSGLLVIAKTLPAHTYLVQALQRREIHREYQAVVQGVLIAGGTIDAPIGRHKISRTKMAVIDSGKPATSHYRIIERFRAHTHIKVILESGRTHQIRVHMAHIHHPVVGEPTYAGRSRLPKQASEELIQELQQLKRQALHACKLVLKHPITQKMLAFQADMPYDIKELIAALHRDKEHEN